MIKVIVISKTHNCPECGADTPDTVGGSQNYLCEACREIVVEARVEKKRDRKKARPWVEGEGMV